MKTIIAGSRNIKDYNIVVQAIKFAKNNGIIPTVIISGKAKGVDTLGEQYAHENNLPIEEFPANWKKYGKSAGVIRNEKMAQIADALIAIWDGKSIGTKNMIKNAKKYHLHYYIFNINYINNDNRITNEFF